VLDWLTCEYVIPSQSSSSLGRVLYIYIYIYIKLHGLSPRANYNNRATAACRRSDCQQRVPRGQRDGSLRPYSRFSRQEPLLFYQVAPQLYSRGWVDPVPDPLLFISGNAGNRTRASGSVAKNSDHSTTEAVLYIRVYIYIYIVPKIISSLQKFCSEPVCCFVLLCLSRILKLSDISDVKNVFIDTFWRILTIVYYFQG
jgi:hypothetical protein